MTLNGKAIDRAGLTHQNWQEVLIELQVSFG
jgi:hypothetical protein